LANDPIEAVPLEGYITVGKIDSRGSGPLRVFTPNQRNSLLETIVADRLDLEKKAGQDPVKVNATVPE